MRSPIVPFYVYFDIYRMRHIGHFEGEGQEEAQKPLGMLINFNETVTIKVFTGVTMLQSSKQERSYTHNTNAIVEPQGSKPFPRAL